MKKRIIIWVISITILILIVLTKSNHNKETIKNIENIDTTIDLETKYEDIDWTSLEEYNLDLNNKSITIDKEGIYTLSGKITNGNITINTTGNIKLILDNVNIKNETGPAIIVDNANLTLIELKNGTNNILEDGENYNNIDYEGRIFSKDDLILEGEGTLNITSNYLDGIVSKDDLKIINGNYIISSNDDEIRGKDSVYILSGNFNITAKGDGIKSTDTTNQKKGYISIGNGIFNIEAEKDGLQAETKLLIYDGDFNIKTSNGSSDNSSAISNKFYNSNSYDTESTKALKSKDNLLIESGNFIIDSKDDAIHSNNYLGIKNGIITISSGDDGIHADKEIIIDNGTITIEKSYEGIEANDITINNGSITIKANDDGINISGGNDSSSQNGRPGQNNISSSSGTLTINNGTIKVNADGDGLDANGSIIINDGNITVDGPTDNGNGALDYDSKFDINGGIFIAVGSNEMAQGISDTSTQYSLMFGLSKSYKDKITLEDSKGNEMISYSPEKTYQSIVVSTPKITKNSTYTLKINNEDITNITVTSINTTTGTSFQIGGPRGKNPNQNPPKTKR